MSISSDTSGMIMVSSGFLNLIWTAAIFVNLFQYEQGPVDAGACLSLYNSVAKLLFSAVWNGTINAAHPLPLHRVCVTTQMDILKWFSGFYLCVCVCTYSIRKSWRSWGLRLSRCALGWVVSACPSPGLRFICWTSSAVLEAWTAQIQTQTRVLTSQHIWIQLRVCFLLLSYNWSSWRCPWK